jgi:hypothetical protein
MGVCSVRKFKVVQSYPEGPHQPHDVGHALAITSTLRFQWSLLFGVTFPDFGMAPAAADYR